MREETLKSNHCTSFINCCSTSIDHFDNIIDHCGTVCAIDNQGKYIKNTYVPESNYRCGMNIDHFGVLINRCGILKNNKLTYYELELMA